MAITHRVYNSTRKCYLKPSQAQKGVEECAWAWVVVGVSVRDLTIREAIERRSQQIKTVEPLPFAEQPGLIFRVPDAMQRALQGERELTRQANEWFRLAHG